MKKGWVPIQGGPRQKPVRLRLGFASDEFGYGIDLGLPTPSSSAFALDPEIKCDPGNFSNAGYDTELALL